MTQNLRSATLSNHRNDGWIRKIQVTSAEGSHLCSIEITPHEGVDREGWKRLCQRVETDCRNLTGDTGYNAQGTHARATTPAATLPDANGVYSLRHIPLNGLDAALTRVLLVMAKSRDVVSPVDGAASGVSRPLLTAAELMLASEALGVASQVDAELKRREVPGPVMPRLNNSKPRCNPHLMPTASAVDNS